MNWLDLKRSLRVKYQARDRVRNPVLFNEAVDVERRAIFVAVPKTGTTSIRTQMRKDGARYMVPRPHLNIREIRDGLRTHAWMQGLALNGQFPTDPKAVRSYDELVQQAETLFADCFKFSMVRNPWARVASLYSRREGVKMSTDMDFETFCLGIRYASDTCRIPTRHDAQLDWVIDDSGQIAVDLVLRLEDMADGLQQVREMTDGRLDFESKKANVNAGSLSGSYRDRYSQAAREHIGKVFRRDIEAFGYSF